MNSHDILLQIEDPLVQMRMQVNRSRLMMRDLMNGYFHSISHQITPADGDSAMLAEIDFNENTIRAEIVDDAICAIEEQLHTLELIRDQLEKDQ